MTPTHQLHHMSVSQPAQHSDLVQEGLQLFPRGRLLLHHLRDPVGHHTHRFLSSSPRETHLRHRSHHRASAGRVIGRAVHAPLPFAQQHARPSLRDGRRPMSDALFSHACTLDGFRELAFGFQLQWACELALFCGFNGSAHELALGVDEECTLSIPVVHTCWHRPCCATERGTCGKPCWGAREEGAVR